NRAKAVGFGARGGPFRHAAPVTAVTFCGSGRGGPRQPRPTERLHLQRTAQEEDWPGPARPAPVVAWPKVPWRTYPWPRASGRRRHLRRPTEIPVRTRPTDRRSV